MRCFCFKCYENEDGYCSCSSYVIIDENGECNMMDIREFGENNEQ